MEDMVVIVWEVDWNGVTGAGGGRAGTFGECGIEASMAGSQRRTGEMIVEERSGRQGKRRCASCARRKVARSFCHGPGPTCRADQSRRWTERRRARAVSGDSLSELIDLVSRPG